MKAKVKVLLLVSALNACGTKLLAPYICFSRPAYSEALNVGPLGFKQETCWFHIPVDREMICGTVTVPENRSKPSGRSVVLPIVQFIPDRERHEPVVFLSGGPGQASDIDNDDQIVDWWHFVDEQGWLRGRRLILFDQRGVGRSKPRLDCSADFTSKTWSKRTDHPADVVDFEKKRAGEIESCRKRIAQGGIDLDNYSTDSIAADIEDIRHYLGVERWTIYGISHGTKIGLTLMDMYPHSVAKAILDSVLPNGINYISMDEVNFNKVIDLLEKACEIDKKCRNGSSIKMMVADIVEQLDASPVMLRVHDKAEGPTEYIRLDGSEFLDIIFSMFYDRDSIVHIPKMVRRTYAQDFRYLVAAIKGSDDYQHHEHYADGMGYSVVCSENDISRPIVRSHPMFAKWSSNGEYQTACPLWFHSQEESQIPAVQKKTMVDVPTLFLSGEFDPVTPPEWAAEEAKRFRNAKTYVLKGVGHDVLDSVFCSSDIISQFLQGKGEIDEKECAEESTEIEFDDVRDYE